MWSRWSEQIFALVSGASAAICVCARVGTVWMTGMASDVPGFRIEPLIGSGHPKSRAVGVKAGSCPSPRRVAIPVVFVSSPCRLSPSFGNPVDPGYQNRFYPPDFAGFGGTISASISARISSKAM